MLMTFKKKRAAAQHHTLKSHTHLSYLIIHRKSRKGGVSDGRRIDFS